MQQPESWFSRALISGTVAGTAIAAAASLAGKRETGSYAAPLNATSHIVWGDSAAQKDEPSLKHTVTGFVLNHAAAIFWAAFYEKWFADRASGSERPRSLLRPLLGGAAVSAGAYVTDYYLVPKRFTPGYEMRLSGKSLATIYCVLALGLIARDVLSRSRRQ